MSSIGSLGELREVEMLDLDNYADQRDFVPIPKAGRYTVQAPGEFPDEAFQRANSGSLTAQVDPVIVDGPNQNYKIRFTRPSAKVYKRNGIPVSQVGDYLRACGVRGKVKTEADVMELVRGTANLIYQADIDWKAYYKPTQFSVEGMDKFPSDGNGGNLPYIEVPGEFQRDEATGEFATDAQGNKIPVTIRANAFIRRFVAAV